LRLSFPSTKGSSMKTIQTIFASMALVGLVGCGSSSEETPEEDGRQRVLGISTDSSCVANAESTVQWDLLNTNAKNLSDYQLFQNPCDPTSNPSPRGLPYDLSVPLFTDYATKYRFVFVPEDETAVYDAEEVFDFPVGTVITKTFTVPVDTSDRTITKEDIVETRLIIKRAGGWITLPYIWNDDRTDATLSGTGLVFETSLTHDSNELTFDYGVPTSQGCLKCHQISTDEYTGAFPIGPKARYLNSDYDYGSGPENQISKWVAEGLLSGVPQASEITSLPEFSDSMDFAQLDENSLDDLGRAWLDINCAHCHREEGGNAENTNFNALWGFSGSLATCNQPISYGGQGLSWIISPGKADESIMIQRMEAVPDGSGDQMPPLGRDLVHSEGVELIKAWINAHPGTPCD